MAILLSSYSSVDDVEALTRHLLDGETEFNSTTRPTLLEVEGFIDQISANLNDAAVACGFSVPIVAAGPKLSCDSWVRPRASAMVELTQRSAGFDGGEDSRYASLWNLYDDAFEFVEKRKKSWSDQGVGVATDSSDALTYTAINKHSERADPTSDVKEQPLFRRRQFLP